MKNSPPTFRIYQFIWYCGLAISLLITAWQPQSPALASPGLPDSTGFGYGAQINPWGSELNLAMNIAASLGLDWVSVDLDWARHWPAPEQAADLSVIDNVMALAAERDLAVMLVLRNAPAWAQTPIGPDAGLTASLVVQLAQRYPGVLQAIELFPAPNTVAFWGAVPNPGHYAGLFQACQTALANASMPVALISGGLWAGAQMDPADWNDVDYLNSLYDAGAAQWLPIVGLRMTYLSGEIGTLPAGEQPPVLRHYEDIRQIMTDHEHASGLLWVTAFNWPDVQTAPGLADPGAQTEWGLQAYRSLRSQLYIGAAFHGCLNPPPTPGGSPVEQCLIQSGAAGAQLHPLLPALGNTINEERKERSLIIEPLLFTKRRPHQTDLWAKP